MQDNRTPAQWWKEVKADPVKFNEWLVKQYRGEVTAATRIVQLGERFEVSEGAQRILAIIAGQEAQHAGWIGELLTARNVELPVVSQEEAEGRYWAATLPAIDSFQVGAAVAAHAEEMRLARIKVIMDDTKAPKDVRDVFTKIYKDELFHARAFRDFTTDEALATALSAHEAGMEALGLTL